MTNISPCFVNANPSLNLFQAVAPVAPIRNAPLAGSQSEGPSLSALAAGLLIGGGAALRSTQRRAFNSWNSGGGGGRSNVSPQDVAQMTEMKRKREAAQFFTYQRTLEERGIPDRDDRFWDMEEKVLFKTSHVSKGIDFSKYDDIKVDVQGGKGDEEPIATFQDACDRFKLPDELTESIKRCGYEVPTPVQKYSIPAVLGGSDVMVAAQTGSGKTAAFLVPIVTAALQAGQKPLKQGAVCPTSVVLAPTRELCQQITVEAKRLTFKSSARVVSIYGGSDAVPQLRELAQGAEIVICTPGRLEDFCQRGVISMEEVKFLTLDEADRMLDMGFEPQIREIIENHGMPAAGERQTMMFSATFPKEMQDMALDFLDPAYYWIGVGRVGATVSTVDQKFVNIGWDDKLEKLVETLNEARGSDGNISKTIVFANTKNAVDDICNGLGARRIKAMPMHGGMTQMQRERAISDLKSGRSSVLVATDVAARGLDLPGIEHVVNYDLPVNGDDYVHRVGRTGRIGNRGTATSFVASKEPALKDIVKHLKDAQMQDPAATEVPQWLEDMVFSAGSGFSRPRTPGRMANRQPRY